MIRISFLIRTLPLFLVGVVQAQVETGVVGTVPARVEAAGVGTGPAQVEAAGVGVGPAQVETGVVGTVPAPIETVPVGRATSTAFPDDESRGSIAGVVVDESTGDPLPGAAVRLLEAGRGRATDLNGEFFFETLVPRTYTLSTQFIGFAPAETRVRVVAGDTVRVTIHLRPSALELPAIVVTGTGRDRVVGDTYRPTAVVSGTELQRQMESSVAQTIGHLPGISVQYNGPAASQAVIRGLGGDRVLTLEDGQRTGDLAATAADHATAIDPMAAERIEVVRGPAGLLYGSNALGGVINVTREEVPRSMPQRFSGTFSAMGETVSDGVSSSVSALMPVGSFALRGEVSGRTAGDVRTPEGALPQSGQQSYGAGVGASIVRGWGYAGLSFRDHVLDYGVPGEFNGRLIPGAHPGGVWAESRRRVARARAAHLGGIGLLRTLEVDGNVNHYRHSEIEGIADGERIVGTRFSQVVGSVNLTARHDHEWHDVYTEGAFGLWFFGRDLSASGRFTGTRSATELAAAGFAYEEFRWVPVRLQVGLRYDLRRITPKDTRPLVIGDRQVPVEPRTFGAFSGSVATLYDFLPGWTAGATIARAYRNPSIEELYSEGPHLADYSFDVGNPALGSEYGTGVDVFVRGTARRVNVEAALFYNRISNYIYYRPTGEIDPRHRRFPVFEARGDDAEFRGAEGRVKWEFVPRFVIDAMASYTRGTRLEENDPLPYLPPLNGRVETRFEGRRVFATLSWRSSAAQERVPRAISSPVVPGETILPQRPTDGYNLFDAGLGFRFSTAREVHTVSLQVKNLTNAIWRDHLSRIKDVAPMPGRNVQLMYRVQF